MIIAGEQKRKFGSILRQYIGRSGIPIYEVAHKTGIKKKTIESHMAGITGPNYEQLFQYEKLLGVDFLNERLALLGLRAVPLEGTELDGCYHAIAAGTTQLAHEINTAHANDGFVDHRERLRIVRLAQRLWPKIARFVAVRRPQPGNG